MCNLVSIKIIISILLSLPAEAWPGESVVSSCLELLGWLVHSTVGVTVDREENDEEAYPFWGCVRVMTALQFNYQMFFATLIKALHNTVAPGHNKSNRMSSAEQPSELHRTTTSKGSESSTTELSDNGTEIINRPTKHDCEESRDVNNSQARSSVSLACASFLSLFVRGLVSHSSEHVGARQRSPLSQLCNMLDTHNTLQGQQVRAQLDEFTSGKFL